MPTNLNEQAGRDWQNGLFGCFGDIRLCLLSFCIPCYVLGKNGEQMGEDCLLVGLLACLGFPFGPVMRWRIRQEKGIKGSMILDGAFWMCVPCCALVQEARELEGVGGGSAPGEAKYMAEKPQEGMARD